MARRSSRPDIRIWKRRKGFSVRGLLIALAVLGGIGAIVYFTFPKLSLSSQDTGPMTHTVALGDFVHDITERGNVESASNVDIRCEVESRGSQGTMILELIDEGTYVKPGDVLCKLDSSSLEQELVQQQIICNTSEAAVIQAQNNYDTALIAKEEYLNGTYVEREQGIEGSIFKAKEDMRVAEQKLAYTKKLYARGYVTKLAVEADEFAEADALKKLEQAQTEMMVLQDYTKKKMLKQLEADIKTSKAKLDSEKHSHELDKEKLEDVTTQIEKCTVLAPDYGQVVYANVTDRRGGSEIIIEEGGNVRERQVIFRLPDPHRMQVKAKINEASVSMVEEGMVAGIRLDAFADLELKGEVEKVNEYPVPTSFFSGSVKEYETVIRIDMPDPEEGSAPSEDPESDGETEAKSDTEEPGDEGMSPTETPEESPAEEPAQADSEPEKPADPETASQEDSDGEEEKDAEEEESKEGDEASDDAEDKVQLRPGMTAEVKIRVETISNVLQVPVQAIVEHGGINYCLMYDKVTGWSKKQVKIGSTNDKMVVIQEGLEEGDKVVLGAAKHREKVTWPKLETIPGVADGEPAGERGPRAGQGSPGQAGGSDGRSGGSGPPNPAQMFKQLDKDSDGKLTEDEAPAQMKPFFSAADKNSDGGVDVAEFSAAMKAAAGSGQGARAPRAGAAGGPGGGGRAGGGPGAGGPAGRPGGGGAGAGARPGGAR